MSEAGGRVFPKRKDLVTASLDFPDLGYSIDAVAHYSGGNAVGIRVRPLNDECDALVSDAAGGPQAHLDDLDESMEEGVVAAGSAGLMSEHVENGAHDSAHSDWSSHDRCLFLCHLPIDQLSEGVSAMSVSRYWTEKQWSDCDRFNDHILGISAQNVIILLSASRVSERLRITEEVESFLGRCGVTRIRTLTEKEAKSRLLEPFENCLYAGLSIKKITRQLEEIKKRANSKRADHVADAVEELRSKTSGV